MEDQVPIMLADTRLYRSAEEHPESQNPYVKVPRDLFTDFRDGLVLDHGAGHQREIYPHVIQLEMVRYPTTDVVGRAEALPFRDDAFDAVYSSAVLEHVENPHIATDEIHRVTKPGGVVLLRVAFMQPYHAYPGHYFNTTVDGLSYLCREFQPIVLGWDPTAAHMLRWVLTEFVEGMEPEARGQALRMTLEEILIRFGEEDYGPFEKIDDETQKMLTPCVYFYGHK